MIFICMYIRTLMGYNLAEAHCYGIGRTGQIVEQSRSSEKQIECRRFDHEGLRQLQCYLFFTATRLLNNLSSP